MKTLFIESKRKTKEDREAINIDTVKLPKELFLAYSIQYKETAEKIKKQLSQNGIKIRGFGQVLGCTKLVSNYPILLIGSGRFHALNLALQNKLVYIYNNSALAKIEEKDLEILKKNKQNAINRFLHAQTLGIIVSTKPGQSNLKQAERLKKKLSENYAEKQVNFFLTNNLNTSELENFSCDLWVNTACAGLTNDSSKIINADDISDFLERKNIF